MEKMKNLAPYITLLGFLIKTIVLPPSLADAFIIASLVSFVIFDQIRLKDTKLAKYDALFKELQQRQEKNEQDLKNTQASINSVKLGIGVRAVNGQKI